MAMVKGAFSAFPHPDQEPPVMAFTLYLKVKKYGLDKLVPDARTGTR